VPLTHESLMRAIELNAAAIEMNKTAFNWGRLAAVDIGKVRDAAFGMNVTPMTDAAPSPMNDAKVSESLDQIVARRVAFLTDYQNPKYAAKFKSLVDKVRAAEQQRVPGQSSLAESVARYAFKLMAYKDEYEVARLYTSGDFEKRIRDTFDGDYKIHFHLAPPTFSRRDSEGHLRKSEFGPWMFRAFKVLAKFKGLRGGALDVFGYTAERKMERKLIDDYFATVDELLARLGRDNHSLAVEIASIPEQIRGYGHIKEANFEKAKAAQTRLMAQWSAPAIPKIAA
jgi:indolepyruvate ferredoxin oxidoreductase